MYLWMDGWMEMSLIANATNGRKRVVGMGLWYCDRCENEMYLVVSEQ